MAVTKSPEDEKHLGVQSASHSNKQTQKRETMRVSVTMRDEKGVRGLRCGVRR